MATDEALNVAWLLVAAALVMLMQAGFSALETGLARTKNSINVAAKNFADFLVSSAVFWILGSALMFGTSQRGIFGFSGFFSGGNGDPWSVAFFLFQLGFIGVAVTIVSGSVAERMRFSSYLLVALLISALIYPVFGHWAWASASRSGGEGWLEAIGFIDFAGSTVVHSVGGWAALAAVLIVGPRIGRFGGRTEPIRGHDLPMVGLGVFILWFGWFGFNGGSTFGFTDDVPAIILNTTASAAFGGLTALALSWWRDDRPGVPTMMNGALAGLVGITASANIVGPGDAVLIGVVSAIVMFAVTQLLERLEIDDAVGAVPVHLGAGVWGTLAVALFGATEAFGDGVGRGEQLLVQLVGIVAAFVWTFGLAYLILRGLNKVFPLRVDPEGERRGLNIAEHGASTETVDLLDEMDAQRRSGDFSSPVRVEPHTEVGRIAQQYNRVLTAFNEQSAQREAAVAGLERKTHSLQLLQIASAAINEAPDLESAYRAVLTEVCAYFGWPVGHVYEVSGDGVTLAPSQVWKLDGEDRFADFVELTGRSSFVVGKGLPGLAAERGRPIRLDLPTEDPRFPRSHEMEAVGITSGFAFPVLAGRQVVAVLEFFTDARDAVIDDATLSLMGSIGTQLGRAVERRRMDETRFRTVVDNMPAMVLLRDLDGRFLLVNRRYEEFYRVANEAIQGRTLSQLEDIIGHGIKADASVRHDRETLAANGTTEHEFAFEIDGRTVVLSSIKFPIPDANGVPVGLGGIEIDITDRKRQEAELASARDAAIRASRQREDALRALEVEHERSESLLLNVMPSSIASRLKSGERTIADRFLGATILFADIVDFTPFASERSPEEVVETLDATFTAFDTLADERALEKIKTIGDAYMVAAGVPDDRPDHARVIADMALAMMDVVHRNDAGGRRLELRIGIHSGPVVAGVIGKRKFAYDLWGDTVNTASRMESSGVPGRIQTTSRVREALRAFYRFHRRGIVDVKGKGQVETWFLEGVL